MPTSINVNTFLTLKLFFWRYRQFDDKEWKRERCREMSTDGNADSVTSNNTYLNTFLEFFEYKR